MDARTLYALAALLLLVQLPHVLHLPLWVSVSGSLLVLLRLLLLRQPDQPALKLLLSPISVTILATLSAVLIKMDYGYFIGRDPSVAFLFFLVAAKFAEVRKPGDATLLLCLAAFLLLTQYFYSQTIIAALVTLPAVISLAYALAILRDPTNPAKATQQFKLVGSLLIQGMPLAALLFVVFPRLPGPLWSLPEDAMATTGLSDSMSPGSIGELSQSDAVAFRVEFDNVIPAPNERYWRGPVLSEFDGRNWTTSEQLIETTPYYRGNGDDVVNYTVMLQPHRQRWLFALDTAASLPHSFNAAADIDRNKNRITAPQQDRDGRIVSRPVGRQLSDGQIIADKPVSQVVRYRQSSVLSDAILPARAPSERTLLLPGNNTRTHAFANKLRNASSSDLDFAHRLLQHFNQESFYYTLKPQLLGNAPVDEFMFDTRQGFCEHYSAAFVVAMRAVGIPSRVVTGYLGGEMNEDYMIVRQSDAHAWAESYIDGAWRRFDPTGAVAPSRVEQGLSAALPNESSVPRLARLESSWLRNAQLKLDAMNHQWQRLVVDFDNDSQDLLWERLGFAKPKLWQLMVVVLVVAAIWCAAVLGLPRLTRSALPINEQLWQRLCRLLESRQLNRRLDESANEYLHRASHQWPQHQDRFARLAQQFEVLRFQALTEIQQQQRRCDIKRDLRRLSWQLFANNKRRTSKKL